MYIKNIMGLQMTSICKIISFFLLIVFTLQVTDIICVGEELSFNTHAIQGEYQHIKADLDKGKSAYPPAGIHDQCPCHLSFMQTLSTEVTSYQSIGVSSFLAGDLFLKKISTDIFQPPKVFI